MVAIFLDATGKTLIFYSGQLDLLQVCSGVQLVPKLSWQTQYMDALAKEVLAHRKVRGLRRETDRSKLELRKHGISRWASCSRWIRIGTLLLSSHCMSAGLLIVHLAHRDPQGAHLRPTHNGSLRGDSTHCTWPTYPSPLAVCGPIRCATQFRLSSYYYSTRKLESTLME